MTLDWVLAGVLVFSLLVGASRGLVYEVLSVLGWAVSFYCAQWLAPQVAPMLPLQSVSEPVRYAVGVLRGVILLLAATVVMDMTALKSSAWWQESRGAQTLTLALAGIKPLLPEPFAKYLN